MEVWNYERYRRKMTRAELRNDNYKNVASPETSSIVGPCPIGIINIHIRAVTTAVVSLRIVNCFSVAD